MSKNRNVADYFAGKGFYIILFLCVAAIGISAYVVFFNSSTDSTADPFGSPTLEIPYSPEGLEPAAPVINPVQIDEEAPEPEENPLATLPSASPPASPSPTPAPTPTPVVTPTPTPAPTPSVSATPTPQAPPSPDKPVATPAADVKPTASPPAGAKPAADYDIKVDCVWPVTGGIVAVFSKDELQYDKTLDDWRTHTGLDISAEIGAKVVSMAPGVIEDIYNDELTGVTVLVNHGDDLFSLYSNLQGEPPVAQSQQVKAGELIGLVGNTSIAESEEKPHLHFEIINKGEQLDPTKVLS